MGVRNDIRVHGFTVRNVQTPLLRFTEIEFCTSCTTKLQQVEVNLVDFEQNATVKLSSRPVHKSRS